MRLVRFPLVCLSALGVALAACHATVPQEPTGLFESQEALNGGTCSDDVPCAMPLLAAGGMSTLTVRSDGSLWAWGRNTYGQLGDGTFTQATTPIAAGFSQKVRQVAMGEHHTLLLDDTGSAWAFGYNFYGQLGDGSFSNSSTPIKVSPLSNVQFVTAGRRSSYAVNKSGQAFAWGSNQYGQLGDTTTNNSNVPVQISGLSKVAMIGGGGLHALALDEDGNVWGWGYNGAGQVGDGSSDLTKLTPVAVSGLTQVVAVAAGYFHSLAVRVDGTVWAWGENGYGNLGQGTVGAAYNLNTPHLVAGVPPAVVVAAGVDHSVALALDGTVWAWGANDSGQLGDGTGLQQTTATAVANLDKVVALQSGDNHVLALREDFSVWAWGANFLGQIGDNSSAFFHLTPVQNGFSWSANSCASLPECSGQGCSATECSGAGTCTNGACVCNAGLGGTVCDTCATNHYDFPNCVFCEAATTCNGHGTCDAKGACVCDTGFSGAGCEVGGTSVDAGTPDAGSPVPPGPTPSPEEPADEEEEGDRGVRSGCGCGSTPDALLPFGLFLWAAARRRRRSE